MSNYVNIPVRSALLLQSKVYWCQQDRLVEFWQEGTETHSQLLLVTVTLPCIVKMTAEQHSIILYNVNNPNPKLTFNLISFPSLE